VLLGNGRYRLERVLGHGGMASVHLAHDSALGRTVAIKRVSEAFAADEDARRRLAREARLAARLSHPNIVRIYDVAALDERPYLVLEHVEGRTLAEELAGRGRLAPDEVARVGRQVASGLAHAHAAGLVHRDVKPRNLLRAADGTVKVADFGIARAADSTQITLAGTVLGTAAYLAPEQARGEPVTPASDVYALGVVLYELLTGRPPHTAASLTELVSLQAAGKITPPGRAADGVPDSLDGVVLACLSLDAQARPSAAEVAAALAHEPVTEGPTAHLPAGKVTTRRIGGLHGPNPRRSGRTPMLVGAAILSAGALAAIGLAAADGGSDGSDSPAGEAVPPPRSDDPAELARELASWLRDQAP
jgi:serine/threonine-protein kinase